MAKETKARGWWHSYGDVIRDSLDLYLGLEDAASELSWYTSELVPGLLQTRDYARTLIRAHHAQASEEDIERLVQVRIARQSLLTRTTAAPIVRVAFNEAVLRRAVGGEEVMAGQLERLIVMTNHPNVSLRVVPFETGFHDGLLSGPFVMMRFPSAGDGHDGVFDAIWSSALNEARSMGFLHGAAREFKT